MPLRSIRWRYRPMPPITSDSMPPPAGLEPAISGSVGRCLICYFTGPMTPWGPRPSSACLGRPARGLLPVAGSKPPPGRKPGRASSATRMPWRCCVPAAGNGTEEGALIARQPGLASRDMGGANSGRFWKPDSWKARLKGAPLRFGPCRAVSGAASIPVRPSRSLARQHAGRPPRLVFSWFLLGGRAKCPLRGSNPRP